jgi:hypothetical protein
MCGSLLNGASCARCIKEQSSFKHRVRRGWKDLEKYLEVNYYVVLTWLAFLMIGLPIAVLTPTGGLWDQSKTWNAAACRGVLIFAGLALIAALSRYGLVGVYRTIKTVCSRRPFLGNLGLQLFLVATLALFVGATQETGPQTRATLPSFAEFVAGKMAGDFTGTVVNKTANQSAPVELALKESHGSLSGCLVVKRPLFGSGPVTGSVHDGAIEFVAHSQGFNIKFAGQQRGDKLSGTYVVMRTQAGNEDGSFVLTRSPSALADGTQATNCRGD